MKSAAIVSEIRLRLGSAGCQPAGFGC